MNSSDKFESRRHLLKWLAGSPLLAFPGLAGLAVQTSPAWPQTRPDPIIWFSPEASTSLFPG
jgi:hypothetical protein